MTTGQRLAEMESRAPRAERLTMKEDGSEIPSLAKIVSSLSVVAAGLDAPKRMRKRRQRSTGRLPL